MIVCPFQPTLFPSLYVFNRANQADMFVMMNSAQFCAANKKEDGSKGKTGQKHFRVKGVLPTEWLSVPVAKELQPLRQTPLGTDPTWRDKLMQQLALRYDKAPYWNDIHEGVMDLLRSCYILGDLNEHTFRWVHKLLGMSCEIVQDYELCGVTKGNDWVISMVIASKADYMITGKPSLNYLDQHRYKDNNIGIIVQDWTCPQYQQLGEGFEPNLSILDALFNIGPEATRELIA